MTLCYPIRISYIRKDVVRLTALVQYLVEKFNQINLIRNEHVYCDSDISSTYLVLIDYNVKS